MNKFKKALLGIGTIATVVAPIAVVVSCGDKMAEYSYAKIENKNIYFVSDGGDIKDKSFNQSVLEGMQAERSITGAEVFTDNVKKPSDPSKIGASYSASKNSGAQLIVASGFNHKAPLKKYAAGHHEIRFALIDGELKLPNIASVDFKMMAPSFIMGILAAKKAMMLKPAAPKVGYYYGMAIPGPMSYINGFKKGIDYYNTHIKRDGDKEVVKVDGGAVGNFDAGGQSRTTANKLVNDDHVSVILAVGGPQYKDALAAVKASVAKDVIIGVDTIIENIVKLADEKDLVYGSILKSLKSMTQDIVNKLKAEDGGKSVLGKTTFGTLANSGAGISIGGVDKTLDLKAALMSEVEITDAKAAAAILAAKAL